MKPVITRLGENSTQTRAKMVHYGLGRNNGLGAGYPPYPALKRALDSRPPQLLGLALL